jgi:metal-responsive CopG/Arc/MetJ family transcriptional regulator
MSRTSVSGRERLNLYFDGNVLEALRRMATARGTTYSELIRHACREYVLSQGGRTVQEVQALAEMTKAPTK